MNNVSKFPTRKTKEALARGYEDKCLPQELREKLKTATVIVDNVDDPEYLGLITICFADGSVLDMNVEDVVTAYGHGRIIYGEIVK